MDVNEEKERREELHSLEIAINIFMYICLEFFLSIHIYFIKFGIILFALSHNLLFKLP